MKIRAVAGFITVILILGGLNIMAWYYRATQGGSILLPVLVTLLSVSFAVYILIKTAFHSATDEKKLQRLQQRRAYKMHWRRLIRQLRRSGGAPRRDPYRVRAYWLVCENLHRAQACLKQHGFTPVADNDELLCWQAGKMVIWVSTFTRLAGDSGQESARQLLRLRPRQPLNGFIVLHDAMSVAALSAEQAQQQGLVHHRALMTFATHLQCRPPLHLAICGLSSVPVLHRRFADPLQAQFCHSTDFCRERQALPDAPFTQFVADLISELQQKQTAELVAGQTQENAVILNFPSQLQEHLSLWEHYAGALRRHRPAGTRLVLSSAMLCAGESSHQQIATPLFERVIHGRDEVIRTGQERRYLLAYSLVVSLCLSGLAAAGFMQWTQWQEQRDTTILRRDLLSALMAQQDSDRVHRLHNLQPLMADLRREYLARWWFASQELPVYRRYQQQIRNIVFPRLAAQWERRLKTAQAEFSPQLLSVIRDYQQLFTDNHIGNAVSDLSGSDDITALLSDYPVQPLSLSEKRLYNSALVADAMQQLMAADPAQVLYHALRDRFDQQQTPASVSLTTVFAADLSPLFQLGNRFAQIPFSMTKAGYQSWQAQWDNEDFQAYFSALSEPWSGNPEIKPDRVIAQINRLYDEEYIQFWQQFLSELSLKKVTVPQALLAQLQLSGQHYRDPVLAVIRGITRNTLFVADNKGTALPDLKAGQQTAAQLGLSKISRKLRKAGRWQSVFAKRKTTDEPDGAAITQAFAGYHSLLTPAGDPSPALVAWQQAAGTLRMQWQQGLSAPDPQYGFYQQLMTGTAEPAAAQLTGVPGELSAWLEQWQQQSSQLQTIMAERWLDSQWQQRVYPFWRDRLAPYYPFTSDNAQSVELTDLHDFLASDGVIAAFLQSLPSGTGIPALARLSTQTEQLRQLFYADGQSALNMRVDISPVSLTPSLSGFRLTQGNDILFYQQGPLVRQVFHWPPAPDAAQLTTDYIRRGNTVFSASVPGEWGLLRWLMSAQARGPARVQEMSVSDNGYEFRFSYRINDKPYPSLSALFSEYRLPVSLLNVGDTSSNFAENPQIRDNGCGNCAAVP
ncbi:MAG TPA: hypothetical protein DIT05_04540 [Morganella sp. (in: Bacteria)]|nr:hypothetical protein [Morganella sp. (in: enterobacteria)]